MVNSEELIGSTEYLTLQARCRINRCRYNRVRLYFDTKFYVSGNVVRVPVVRHRLPGY
jgi:hypothetical protein